VAPKPPLSQGPPHASSHAITFPSAALRGATSAFTLPPQPQFANKNNLTGARLAAAAACSPARRSNNGHTGKEVASSEREYGKPLISKALHTTPIAVAASANSATLAVPSLQRPGSSRSPSAVAARFASANASPARSNHQIGKSSPIWQEGSGPLEMGPSTDEVDVVNKLANKFDALSGAGTFMQAPNGSAVHQSLDFKKTPVLQRQLSPGALATPVSGMAAARFAAQQARNSEDDTVIGQPLRQSQSPSIISTATSTSTSVTTSPESREVAAASDSSQNDYFRYRLETSKRSVVYPPFSGNSSAQAHSQPRDIRTGMTVNSLADAMVASSLASTRAGTSPRADHLTEPGNRRRSRSLTSLHRFAHHHSTSPKAPPPPPQRRPMKQTLRKPSVENDDEDESAKHRRRHRVRKHPNQHHEGDRKRWRDRVTDTERKRYEGVWAANRGAHLDWTFSSDNDSRNYVNGGTDTVVNVIVRDIWERSRLPRDVLEEIWDLVANPGSMALGREEFVIGMYLIDQRLKVRVLQQRSHGTMTDSSQGRKLPSRVSASIVSSVRHCHGVKMPR